MQTIQKRQINIAGHIMGVTLPWTAPRRLALPTPIVKQYMMPRVMEVHIISAANRQEFTRQASVHVFTIKVNVISNEYIADFFSVKL